MALYDDLRGSLTFRSGRTYGTSQTERDFQQRIGAAQAQARKRKDVRLPVIDLSRTNMEVVEGVPGMCLLVFLSLVKL